MNTYTIHFTRMNLIPASKTVNASTEKEALCKFQRETIFREIVKVEKS